MGDGLHHFAGFRWQKDVEDHPLEGSGRKGAADPRTSYSRSSRALGSISLCRRTGVRPIWDVMAADVLVLELDRVDRTLRRLEDEVARMRLHAPAATRPAAAQLFERRVEVDAGPFADFDEVTAFEHALGVLADVSQVEVRRFFGRRAIVELAAVDELPLLERLREVLPGGFSVDYAERDALRITLAPGP